MMDEIIIKNLKIYAFHGVNLEEKHNGQNFLIDVTAFADLTVPCNSDNVDDTVSYSAMTKTITEVFVSHKYNLIEKAAGAVADSLFKNYPAIMKLEVTVKKPEPPMKAEFDYMAVKITRSRN